MGKYINELRRKTKNDLLAKRAKDLVRRWRDMILPSAPGDVNVMSVNGKSQPTSPDPPVEAVPRTHAANKRLRKEDSPDSKMEEPVTKLARLNGSSVRSMFTPERGESSRDGFSSKSDNDLVPSIDEEADTGPKKRGRKKGSKNRSTLAKAAVKSREDLVEDKIVALARTPKVKTTQELLADLRSRSGEELPLVKLPQSIENKASLANCVLTKSEPHDDEDDDVDIIEVVKTKSLAKQECDTSSNSNNVVIEKERKSKKHNNTEAPSVKSLPPPPTVPPEPSSVEDIMSRLPPLNLDEIDWSEDSYSVPNSPRPITDTDVDRLHTEHCEGLNGNWETRDDQKTEFREWQDMVTIHSSQDPNEPPLYALPYVVID